MRRTLAGLAFAAALTPLLLWAYEPGGHYYTVASVLGRLRDPLLHTAIVCAQLPDQVDELDAIGQVRAHKLATLLELLPFVHGDADQLARVRVVHELLHGLNGGRAAEVQKAAEATLRQLADDAQKSGTAADACAAGFALHLYGDSFAHRQLDNHDFMYGPIQGHLSGSTFPDLPLYEHDQRRPWKEKLWEKYALSLVPIFAADGGSAVAAAVQDQVLAPARALPGELGPELSPDAVEEQLEARLRDAIPAATGWTPPDFGDSAPCEEVRKRVGELDGFSCLEAWTRFRTAAVPRLSAFRQGDWYLGDAGLP